MVSESWFFFLVHSLTVFKMMQRCTHYSPSHSRSHSVSPQLSHLHSTTTYSFSFSSSYIILIFDPVLLVLDLPSLSKYSLCSSCTFFYSCTGLCLFICYYLSSLPSYYYTFIASAAFIAFMQTLALYSLSYALYYHYEWCVCT